MVLCYLLSGVLALVVVLYWSLEVHYFLRMGLCVLHARLFKKKLHILDSTSVTGEHYNSTIVKHYIALVVLMNNTNLFHKIRLNHV